MRFIRGHNSVGMDRSKPYKSERYRVEDRGYETPCWIWRLKRGRNGYGVVRVAGHDYLAHRAYYEQAHGPIEGGLHLDHLCRVRECVNPAHLEPVTPKENARRGAAMKLTARQASMIEVLARSGEFSNAEIGRRFKVTRETVRLIGKHGAVSVRRGVR